MIGFDPLFETEHILKTWHLSGYRAAMPQVLRGKMAFMENTTINALEISSGPSPDASIIWLHGLGADGHDFAPIVDEMQLPIAARFILPHAPLRAITINGGYRMPGWDDIYSTEISAIQDAPGIRASQALIETLIAREQQRGVAAQRILLAGFSQGGAIALQTGLRHADRLGGILALSTYLPLQDSFALEASAANKSIPIFMAHGHQDSVIAPERAAISRDFLTSHGYAVSWHDYAMGHSVCPDEIRDIRKFILDVLETA